MFKATAAGALQTTIIGSLPRPRWYTVGLQGRAFRVAMADGVFREQYLDAVSSLMRDQERAGIDILTDGDSRFDIDVGGSSWQLYPAHRLGGTSGAFEFRPFPAFDYGIFAEFAEASPLPVVTGPVHRGALDYTSIWQTARRLTPHPVKFGTPAAEVIEGRLVNRHYADRAELVLAIADALNAELGDLADAGCPAVQVEAPWVTRSAHGQAGSVWSPAFYADVFNRTTAGLRARTEVWCHTCWGNPAGQTTFAELPSYAPVLDLLDQLECDVITFENAASGCMDLEAICRGIQPPKKIALGVVSHRTLQVERPEQVAAIIRQALALVPPERLVLTADCGFGREGMSRRIALFKMVSLVLGANRVRRELGLPEQPCLAGQPLTEPTTA